MDQVLKDERFAHIGTDPRFRSIPRSERKVQIDKRFQSMFTSDNFKVKYTVDKRGRPIKHSTNENLKKYYDLSSSSSEGSESEDSDDDEKPPGKSKKSKKAKAKPVETEDEDDSASETEAAPEKPKFDVDYARGEGAVETSSSEDDDDSAYEEEETEEAGLIHPWGELDGGATEADTLTHRLAVCNMDWDRITARDLYVLLDSFVPAGGIIKTVKVYLSDYGRERLREEEVSGPMELTSAKPLDSDDESVEVNQEGEKYHMEKLRQYQLNRLKYFYAVVECDSVATASKIYEECDGLEYESSAARLDLRYIPDDMEFDQEPHSMADVSTNASGYQPKKFTTTALQQAKVKLTWDETDPDRLQVIQRAFEQGEQENMDLSTYLASSSDSESEAEIRKRPECRTDTKDEEKDDEDDENDDNYGRMLKYKALMRGLEENENKKKKDDDVHLEITWGTGLKEKAEKLIKHKIANEDVTPWQEYLNKKKEKRQQKREDRKKNKEKEINKDVENEENPYSDDELPSDVDLDDPFFKQNTGESSAKKASAKKGKKKQKPEEEDEETKKHKEELELLLMDKVVDGKRHYNLKKLLKAKAKAKKEDPEKNDGFQIDVADSRFSAIFNSHEYNIDPSDQNFKRTEGMEALINEKQKRQLEQADAPATQPKREKRPQDHEHKDTLNGSEEAPKRSSRAIELAMLVKSVKSKASNFKRKSNKPKS